MPENFLTISVIFPLRGITKKAMIPLHPEPRQREPLLDNPITIQTRRPRFRTVPAVPGSGARQPINQPACELRGSLEQTNLRVRQGAKNASDSGIINPSGCDAAKWNV